MFVVYLFLLALAVDSGDGVPPTSSGDTVCVSKSPPAAAGSEQGCAVESEAGSDASRVLEGKRRLSLVTPRRRESVLTVTNNEELEAEGGCEMEG